jgi:hypothetical protein
VRPSLLFCGLTGPGLEVAQDQFPDGLKAVPSRIVSTLMRGRRRVPAGENGDGVVVEVSVSAGLDRASASVSHRYWSGPGCWRGHARG